MNFSNTFSRILLTLIGFLASGSALMAAGGGHEGGHHKMPLNAEQLFGPVSNSILMCWISVGLIVLFCKAATKDMKLVPAGFQNFAEWVIESLYDFFGNILGEHLIKRTFWFFGSVFVFILVNNYMGLFPGVGTVGLYGSGENLKEPIFRPFFRGANADLNLTAAMAFTFAILWFYWAITENGVKGFFEHIFAPKGDFKGIMMLMMIPIFLFVGVLEMISIAIRPVALSFRLFGNIYGGEQTLESLMALVPHPALHFLPALPFYFVELLVGLIQALVFTLLCAIFLRLICDHSHGDDHEEAH
ncbi:F0F1 ATP synthase subunit A [Roseibacillus persicicus]|uniref:ATP synthase subunit a n=1 Tax=Roseibacillus persicicus TaxID=454148 RepID=A0A918WLR9_9BACT|nr:F0F1 ATP synthase subunit A [Roseibacillus persicicus]MDQ8191350.1 F0F1 ATP synthase subunit A [Roseibacillus persicicus]GHC54788.1 ATP synthase subunit a [Roseibacillus persicicus]